MRVATETPAVRFARFVGEAGPTGCRLWTGKATRRPGGPGAFRIDGKLLSAPRVAWELAYGPIPDGKRLDLTCGERACLNVGHMILVDKGRAPRRRSTRPRTPEGYHHFEAKVPADLVARLDANLGGMSRSEAVSAALRALLARPGTLDYLTNSGATRLGVDLEVGLFAELGAVRGYSSRAAVVVAAIEEWLG